MKVLNDGPHQISRRAMMLAGIAAAASAAVGLPRKGFAVLPIEPLDNRHFRDFAHAHISDYMIAL